MNDIVKNYEKYLQKKENGKEVNEDKHFLLKQGFLIPANKTKEVMKNFIESHTNKYGRLYIAYIENYYTSKEDKLNFFTIKASNGTLFSFKVVEVDNEFYVPIEEFFKNDSWFTISLQHFKMLFKIWIVKR